MSVVQKHFQSMVQKPSCQLHAHACHIECLVPEEPLLLLTSLLAWEGWRATVVGLAVSVLPEEEGF